MVLCCAFNTNGFVVPWYCIPTILLAVDVAVSVIEIILLVKFKTGIMVGAATAGEITSPKHLKRWWLQIPLIFQSYFYVHSSLHHPHLQLKTMLVVQHLKVLLLID